MDLGPPVMHRPYDALRHLRCRRFKSSEPPRTGQPTADKTDCKAPGQPSSRHRRRPHPVQRLHQLLHRHLSEPAEAVVHGPDVVDDFVHVACGRFIPQEIRLGHKQVLEGTLGALDLTGEDRLFPDVHEDEQVGIRERQDGAIETAKGVVRAGEEAVQPPREAKWGCRWEGGRNEGTVPCRLALRCCRAAKRASSSESEARWEVLGFSIIPTLRANPCWSAVGGSVSGVPRTSETLMVLRPEVVLPARNK